MEEVLHFPVENPLCKVNFLIEIFKKDVRKEKNSLQLFETSIFIASLELIKKGIALFRFSLYRFKNI